MIDSRYIADVGFVKHGVLSFEDLWEHFKYNTFGNDSHPLFRLFSALYQRTCFGGSHYRGEMEDFVLGQIASASEGLAHQLKQIIWYFFVTVYSSAWRCRFLEAVDKAGIELALYGNNWEKHSRLGHLARGPVDRETELNFVYNYNKINLHVHHHATMHQRVVECALAGGFMMIADHEPEHDDESARKYFKENEEVVFFKDTDDLVDKCRYYLGRPIWTPRRAG